MQFYFLGAKIHITIFHHLNFRAKNPLKTVIFRAKVQIAILFHLIFQGKNYQKMQLYARKFNLRYLII